ncbi:MAG: FHA domain-containing protein [Nitrospirae bacterium]|nr:MAG: FHA domain-containing protein [Nitrospirota bacterium]
MTNRIVSEAGQSLELDPGGLAIRHWPQRDAHDVLNSMKAWMGKSSLPVGDGIEEDVQQTLHLLARLVEPHEQVRFLEIYKGLLATRPAQSKRVSRQKPASTTLGNVWASSAAESNLRSQRGYQIEVRYPDGQIVNCPLTEPVLLVGRSAECQLVLRDPKASRQHLVIERQADQVLVKDLGSTNGTFLEDERIPSKKPIPWQVGQVMRVGRVRLRIQPLQPEKTKTNMGDALQPSHQGLRSADESSYPRKIHVASLDEEVSMADITILSDNQLIGFYSPADTTYYVEPGTTESIPVVVINLGHEPAMLALKAENVPPAWISLSNTQFRLAGGEQHQCNVYLSPPRHPLSRAGNYKLKVSLADLEGEAESGPMWASRPVSVRVKQFVAFTSKVESQQTGSEMTIRVSLHNLSNGPLSFTVSLWGEASDAFSYTLPQDTVFVDFGQEHTVELRVSLKRRSRIWGARRHRIAVQIAAGQGESQIHYVDFEEKRFWG